MTAWTVAEELLVLAGESDLADASRMLNLPTVTSQEQIEVVRDWWRGGAETYCMIFALHPRDEPPTEYILKSFVPAPGTYSVAEALTTTLERQHHLATLGAKVPQCYGAARGTALVEYIEHNLEEFLSSETTPEDTCQSLCSAATHLARIVTLAGYKPIDFVRDLRTDGEDVFLIDFGWDLGPPGVTQADDCRLAHAVAAWCSKVLARRMQR